MDILDEELAPRKNAKIYAKFKVCGSNDIAEAIKNISYKTFVNNKTPDNWKRYEQNQNGAVQIIRRER